MSESLLLQDLGAILVAGTALSLLLRPLRVPSLVSYIASGLLLGPVSGVVSATAELHLISELGVVLLLFLVGLELSLERIRDVGRVAVLAGLAQVAATCALGFGAGLALGFGPAAAAIAGLAVSFSSTAVVIRLLDRRGQLRARHGRLAVGILLVQDVVVIVSLTVVAGLGTGAGAGAGPVWRLAGAVGGMAVLAGSAALAARTLLPALFGRVASDRETLFVWSVAWCFLFILGAEAFHLSLELGAFLAGLALAQLPVAHDLSRRVGPVTSFFLAVFFVALGVELEPGAAAAAPAAIALLAVVVLPCKGLVLAWSLARLGQDEETAFRTGLTLSQASEFSFILVGLGASVGLVPQELAAVVAVVGLGTIALSSYGILESGSIYARLRGGRLMAALGARPPEAGPPAGKDGLAGHVVVVGMNALGRTLVARLAEAGIETLAVDTDPRKLEGLPGATLHGSAQDPAVLDEAGLERACLLVSALRIEDVNVLLAHRCREAGVPVSVHGFEVSAVERLLEERVDHVILSRDGGTRRMADHLRSLGLLA